MEIDKDMIIDVEPTAVETHIPLEAAREETAIEGHYMDDVALSEAEKKTVADFSKKIDLSDSNLTAQYGAAAQQKVADFSDVALEGVKTKELGEVSNMLSGLVTELRGFSIEPEKKGIMKLFSKGSNAITRLRAQYTNAEKNIDKIETSLLSHQNQLHKDIVLMDKMYEANISYFKELTMYIVAGKQKIEEEKNTTLPALRQKAEASGLAEDAQAVNDFNAQLERFEKKLYDLELTRNVSIQMAPQIRMIQNNDIQMVERIQSSLTNTIPLWKNQMVLSLGMAHAQQATEAEKQVTDLTNELLKKNAEALKQGTIAVAVESERAVIDIETLKETNQKLIETFDEVIRIQAEGREKRVNAENELGRIESELKAKLLEVKKGQI